MGKWFFILIVVIASVFLRFQMLPRSEIPDHLTGHPLVYEKNLIDADVGAELNAMIKEMGSDGTGFPTNVSADTKTKAVVVKNEHIGEARPKKKGESCHHTLLVPDINDEKCILPQRIDIGRHFILYGGPEAIREPWLQMVNRVSSFGRYMFDLTQYPIVEKLFNSEKFQKNAKSVCPADK